ncbi:unnamed protein product [Ambrosiozyma monospora]|uniref:Ribokinase n=1 Tax=Ambrosiozyma monospora TaxID=43982 RepID=A0A9W6YWQ2_AMBMO|nr:unnamed protein product [Ambrosiozyma monospora]
MITIIGSLNYDLVTFTSRVPEAGETIQGNSFEGHLGGKGLNEAIAVARLSSPEVDKSTQVRMWGKIGDDYQGVELFKCLEVSGIDMNLVQVVKGEKSGTATILVEESGENRIIIVAGANGKLQPDASQLNKHFPVDSADQLVVLQNEFPNPEFIIDWLTENRPKIQKFYNPSPLVITPERLSILNKVEYLIVNEIESFELLKGLTKGGQVNLKQLDEKETTSDIIKHGESLISELRAHLPHPTLIITLGSKGCLYQITPNDKPGYQPSCKVDTVVDTTGAGDTFFGGLVSKLHEGLTLDESLKFATFASSLAIQKKGAVEGIPFYADVCKAMKQ